MTKTKTKIRKTGYQYSVYCDQKGIMDLGLIDEIDIIDLAIYNCCQAIEQFPESTYRPKLKYNGSTYFLVEPNEIISRLPIIRINSRSPIKARLATLCNHGFLEKHPDNEISRQPFYCLGPTHFKWTGMTEEDDEDGSSSEKPKDRFLKNDTPERWSSTNPPPRPSKRPPPVLVEDHPPGLLKGRSIDYTFEKERNREYGESEGTQPINNSSFSSSKKYIEPVHPTDIGELSKKLNAIITKQKGKSELWADYFKAGKARKISDLCEAMYAAGFVYEHDGGLRAYAERLMKGDVEEEERVEAEKEELEHEPVAKRCLETMKTERFKGVIVNKHDINKLLLWIDEIRNRKEWGGYDFTGDGAMFYLFEHIMVAYMNEDMPEGFKRTLGHALKWWCQTPDRKNEIQSNAGTYYGEEGKDADEWWSWTDEMRKNVFRVEEWVNENRKLTSLYACSLEAYIKIGRWILKMKEEGHTMAYLVLTKSALEIGRPGAGMIEMDDIDKHYIKNKARIDLEVYGEAAA